MVEAAPFRPSRRVELLSAACILAAMAFVSMSYLSTLVIVTAQRLHGYDLHGARMADPVCFSPFCDFTDFWAAGILARSHLLATLYQPDAFLAWRRALFGPGIPPLNWMYPPPALFPAILVSFAPLLAGYFVWVFGLIGAAWFVLWRAGIGLRYIAAAMLGPAALWNLYIGQLGILCGALLVAGLVSLPRRPGWGGLALACLMMKPQYCFLTPVVLLAESRRALLAGVGAGFAILLICLFCFGLQPWQLFLGPARLAARGELARPDPGDQIHAISVFWALLSFHVCVSAAFAGQAASALGAAFIAWRAWRRPGADPAARLALTTCLLPLATPYGYTDDLFGLTLAFVMLARRDRPGLNLCAFLIWVAPAVLPLIYVRWHILLAPLCFAFGAVIAWRRMVLPGAHLA